MLNFAEKHICNSFYRLNFSFLLDDKITLSDLTLFAANKNFRFVKLSQSILKFQNGGEQRNTDIDGDKKANYTTV